MPQATVKSYDHDARTATLMYDDLTEIDVAAEPIRASGLLELRLGQRVRFELDGDDVTNLDIVSM